MADGMRHGMSLRSLKICGKLELKHGAASMAGNADFPMQSADVNPNIFWALL